MEQIQQQREELAQPDRQASESPSSNDGGQNPDKRGIELLKESLSAAQRDQYAKHQFFYVIGGDSGKFYRVRHGSQMNIDEFDENGNPTCKWCFFPTGDLVAGDIMLAQKTALELFKRDALKVANSFPPAIDPCPQRDPWSHGMPRDGAIVFGDLGKLKTLRVVCTKCNREGRYLVRRLIEDHGLDVHVIDWLAMLTADCPEKNSGCMETRCEAYCSTLICRA
jgi:hypothetical protein